MNVLLIYPKYPDTFWSFKHCLSFVRKKASLPPLGLLTVASMMPKSWNLKAIDMNVDKLKDENIIWADMIFISAMIVQEEGVKDIVKRANEFGRKVVAGGPLFTTRFDDLKGIDHFILNEAEVTFPMFIKDFENKKLKRVYSSDIKPDIDSTPLPRWDLIDLKNYATMSVQYSRGCPFNCEFCDIIIMNGRVPRTKSPQTMLKEFDILFKHGWRGTLFIVDDNFIGNKAKVKELLKHVIVWQKKHKFPFKLMTEASVDLSDDEELLKLMRKANFFKVFLGIETPDNKCLKECGKNQNMKDITESIRKIHSYGMQVLGGFIVGFDSDSDSIFERQFSFIQEMGVATAMVGMLTALPQTRLWDRLKTEGRLIENSSGCNTDGNLNFVPTMGQEKLISGYKKLLLNVYDPKNYYKRIEKFIKVYKPKVKAKIKLEDIRAFFVSVWRIGIISNSRDHYWRILIKTLATKAKAFPIVVELAIFGEHFLKVAKEVNSSR